MDRKEHFKLLANYNLRLNHQVYTAAATLDEATLNKDLGAFFGSILGTLNHIMVGDLFWLSRFETLSNRYSSLRQLTDIKQPKALDDIIFASFEELHFNRTIIDHIIINWTHDEIDNEDFKLDLSYKPIKGGTGSRNCAEVLAHLFNHQTHHRGQVSTLLSQHNIDIGTTDFLIDIPDSTPSL
ncbi:DinB family protein [Oceanicoccus sagamiensis]|uniref:Damage-inducible protein DinB n=1 Tax=Oceanicoccus sagamiensis TaxID=716816 RepID=A0A1X9N8Y2_9GAMM|nr:DinB family protein [Oceanicoccus sagamiensis]ARN74126.1 damage-inducible protein DinB [Oceanicoccus sagamiensis]